MTGSRIWAKWSELTLSERNQLHREGRDLVPSAVTGSPAQPGAGGQRRRGEGSERAVVEEMLGGHRSGQGQVAATLPHCPADLPSDLPEQVHPEPRSLALPGTAHSPHPLRRHVQTQRSQTRAFSHLSSLGSERVFFLSPWKNKLRVVYSTWNFSRSLSKEWLDAQQNEAL